LADKVKARIKKDMQQQQTYYQSLSDVRRDNLSFEEERNDNLLKALLGMEQQFEMQKQMEAGGTIKTQPVAPGDSQPQ